MNSLIRFPPRDVYPDLASATNKLTCRQTQSGQALTEFIVISLALVPLFLLMPLIAKYQDIAHATQMASRYVAFEAMTRNDGSGSFKPESQLADEVRRRFFSNTDAPVKTNDTAGDFKANQNMFWSDPKGDPLIKKFSDVQVTFGKTMGATHSDAFSAGSDGKAFILSKELGLQTRGVYTANVSVKLANLPASLSGWTSSYEQFKNMNLSISRTTAVLIDPWTAANPDNVISHINTLPSLPLLPGKALSGLKSTVDLAVAVTELPKNFPTPCTNCGPKLGDLQFWSDLVPADRLQ
jgi:hypothetical protein